MRIYLRVYNVTISMAKYQTLSLRQKPKLGLKIEFLLIVDLWKFLGQIRSLGLLEEEDSETFQI